MPIEADPAGAEVDGRHARRHRNRAAVIEAAIALFEEGHGFAGLQEIADRAGVSLRSLHRYFDDADDLVAAALDEYLGALEPALTELPAGDRPIEERVTAWVDGRLATNERTASALLAVSARAQRSEAVATVLTARRGVLVDRLRALFAPELEALPADDRHGVLAAVHTVTTAQTFATVHWRHGVAADVARAHTIRQIRLLLAPDEEATP